MFSQRHPLALFLGLTKAGHRNARKTPSIGTEGAPECLSKSGSSPVSLPPNQTLASLGSSLQIFPAERALEGFQYSGV